ncbi:uncharacterized protein [Ptychodera flava]|uniref:uncharacterized protein isoform X3 n=1 Tax=Ptychodera flava TaxID=63121 RepID=UPI00396A49E8
MWKLGLWMSIESDDDVESRDDSMEQEDATPAENQGLVCGLMEADLKPSEHLYAEQITMAEYQKQSEEYTKQCLQQLLNSEEYQRIYKTCTAMHAGTMSRPAQAVQNVETVAMPSQDPVQYVVESASKSGPETLTCHTK